MGGTRSRSPPPLGCLNRWSPRSKEDGWQLLSSTKKKTKRGRWFRHASWLQPNYEDYFDLQLRVATAYAQLGGLTRSTAIARFANLRRRFGLADVSGTAEWEGFLNGVPEDAEHEELLARTLEWYEHRPTVCASRFGCFSYDPPDAHGVLRIHFMPEEQHCRDSPLGDARISERQSELQAMIADVRHRYSNAATFGASRGFTTSRRTGGSFRRSTSRQSRSRRLLWA